MNVKHDRVATHRQYLLSNLMRVLASGRCNADQYDSYRGCFCQLARESRLQTP